jgi:hypothetical protein
MYLHLSGNGALPFAPEPYARPTAHMRFLLLWLRSQTAAVAFVIPILALS